MNVITVIPSRLSSYRLPNKALADIHNEPMIVHVWRRGIEANLGPVIVACGDQEIARAIEQVGGLAIMTDPDLNSGTDRVCAALDIFDPLKKYDTVINLQGDMPTVDTKLFKVLIEPLKDSASEISTLATVITDSAELKAESIVKVCIARPDNKKVGRGLYFSRNIIPWGNGDYYHHIGLYGYKRNSLINFCKLPLGVIESREKLEQLRAIENGMRIDVSIVDANPLGVDIFADLIKARIILKKS